MEDDRKIEHGLETLKQRGVKSSQKSKTPLEVNRPLAYQFIGICTYFLRTRTRKVGLKQEISHFSHFEHA